MKSLTKALVLIAMLCSVLVLSGSDAGAQVGGSSTLDWAVTSSGSGGSGGIGVTVDSTGSTYVTGSFSGTETWGTSTFTAVDDLDMFVAKYDPSGSVVWAASAGSTDFEFPLGIRTDAAGNVYVSGIYAGSMTFGSTTFNSAGDHDIFLVKYDSSGALVWAETAGSVGRDFSGIFDVDSSGNSYLVGSFDGTLSIGGSNVVGSGDEDMYLAKFDTAGNLDWVQTAGQAGEEIGLAAAVDGAGNIYTTGRFENAFTLGTTTLPAGGASTMFLAKWDASGTVQWATANAGSGSAQGLGLDTLGTDVFLVGDYDNTISVGGSAISSLGDDDTFIAKYDGSGSFQWVDSVGGADRDSGRAIAVDAAGNVYHAASFTAPVTVGTGSLNSSIDASGYIAKHDTNGNLVAAELVPATGVEFGPAVAVSPAGEVYMTSVLTGALTVNGNTTAADGQSDTLLLKYSSIGGGVVLCAGLPVTINMQAGATGTGTAGDDVILGTSGSDLIDGNGGDDTICGEGGDDIITGGDGRDFIYGGDGNDSMFGDAGNDRIRGQKGTDSIDGGDGNDFLYGGTGDDTIDGDAGNDVIGGFGGADNIDGGPGNDRIFGGFGADDIDGGPGDDIIRGLVGNDIINGQGGNDSLNGDNGQDTINGGDGNDTIKGGNSTDILRGNDGDDNLQGGKADDDLSGGLGIDVCTGNTEAVADTADSTCESTFGIP